MDAYIYMAASGKGPRKQSGTGAYLVELTDGQKTVSKTFGFRYENLSEQSASLQVFTRCGGFLARLTHVEHFYIYTASEYVRSGFYRMRKWNQDGWKNAKGKDVANKEMWQQIEQQTKGYKVDIFLELEGKTKELQERLRKEM
jgi:ribonuclease HI